jgi:hypothetical protein
MSDVVSVVMRTDQHWSISGGSTWAALCGQLIDLVRIESTLTQNLSAVFAQLWLQPSDVGARTAHLNWNAWNTHCTL